jgi:pimeloyl-ACP methyl ester carboxylesterase
MKKLHWVATFMFVAAGILLLCAPAHAAIGTTPAFVPTRFTVVDAGTLGKPDLILIPGLSSSREVWSAEAAKLAPNFRLHLVQINGFAGQAAGPNAGDAPMLPPIVDELHGYIAAGKMHPVVMGHSLGGLLTLMLAAKYPADVSKLVIVDALPFYALIFGPQTTVEAVKPQAEAMKAQLAGIPQEQWVAMQPMMAPQMVKDPAGQKAVAANSGASDRAIVAKAMVEDIETDMRPDLANIKAPTLVLYEHDTTLAQPDADKYEATMLSAYKPMPNVKLVQVDGARHFIMYDKPEKFDAEVEAFLK